MNGLQSLGPQRKLAGKASSVYLAHFMYQFALLYIPHLEACLQDINIMIL